MYHRRASEREFPLPETEDTVVNAIRELLARRQDGQVNITLESDLYEDLRLESLEIAEFSAMLEDDLGRDPYTEGEVPRTVAEVVGFYNR
jgi:acyl carrier protein